MTLRNIIATALLVLTPSLAQAGSAASDPAYGLWLTANGKAIVEFAPCGGTTCGRMVWVANPRDDAGKIKLDLENSDGAKRSRPICGIELLGGLDRSAPGTWKDGWIYNPRDGSTYSASIEAVAADKLKVRGYLGIEALGSSQVWTRVSSDRGGCTG